MTTLNLGLVADEVLTALGDDPVSEARLRLAIQLFVEKRLSAGGAADLASLSKIAFLHKLADRGVSPYEMTPAELERDSANAERASGR